MSKQHFKETSYEIVGCQKVTLGSVDIKGLIKYVFAYTVRSGYEDSLVYVCIHVSVKSLSH